MDMPEQINQIIEAIKADKSIVQPWRNYALKAANEIQAFVKMGRTVSNLTPPLGQDLGTAKCTCPLGGMRADCPVHKSQTN